VGHFLPSVNVLPDGYSGVRKDLGDTEGIVELLSEDDATKYYQRETSNSRRAKADEIVTKLERQIRALGKKGDDVSELTAQLDEAKKIAGKYKMKWVTCGFRAALWLDTQRSLPDWT